MQIYEQYINPSCITFIIIYEIHVCLMRISLVAKYLSKVLCNKH